MLLSSRLSERRHRRVAWPAAALVLVLAAAALLVARAVLSRDTPAARPDLQRILDRLVTGRDRVAPGVTAYVAGPHGTWIGSAGLANVKAQEPMPPDARLRLDSNSKAWTATLILQLAGEGKLRLDDTVARWLPGLLPDGGRITVRELLNHTSGLIDDNDVTQDPQRYLRQVHDSALRAEFVRLWQQERVDPTLEAPTTIWVRLAAALPLRSEPGTTYHYSNIGYAVAGLIAAKAGASPLAALYRQRIIEPLGLASVGFKPQGETGKGDPRDYSVRLNGTLVDATGWYRLGGGAAGGIVANAGDEAHFLTALMQGRLLQPAELQAMKTTTPASGNYGLGLERRQSGCAGVAYQHGGASYSTTSSILVSGDGTRVAVVLLNGNTLVIDSTLDPRAGNAAVAAAARLFCAA